MKYFILLTAAICYQFIATAQNRLVIRINSLPNAPVAESIYVSGNFNGWNPKDELCRLKKGSDGTFSIAFPNVPSGDYEYKFTRGGWETVETTGDGRQIA